MRHLLHDRIDETEELRDKASELVESVVKREFENAIENSGGNLEKALGILARDVGEELADLTTESVRRGFQYAEKRAAHAKGA